jgi:hypothetical protein
MLVRAAVRSAARSAVRAATPRSAGYVAPGYAAPALGPAPAPADSSGCLTAFLVLCAIGGSFFGLIGLIAGIGMMVSPINPNDPQSGIVVVVLTAIFCVVPAVLSIWGIGYTRGRRKRLYRLVSLVETHARLPIATVASELQMDADGARKLLLEGVELGLVKGRLDIEDGVFFSETVAQPAVQHHTAPCPGCGATVSATIIPGKPVDCPYCGRRLV